MSSFEDAVFVCTSHETTTYRTRRGRVVLDYDVLPSAGRKPLKSYSDSDWLSRALYVRVIVHLVLPRKRQVSARFTSQEVIDLLARFPPTSEDFVEQIAVVVQERKENPPATASEAQEKSFGAQGQTKKPGSHSHDRHK